MAINQNHTVEELNGVRCAIVEKMVSPERVKFLKSILEHNGYSVVVTPSPPAKAVAAAKVVNSAAESTPEPAPPDPVIAETFTMGVTDVMFNVINAIFGRLLKLPGGHIVTLAYWQQTETEPKDEVPYFVKR
jgi:hypothetical protein